MILQWGEPGVPGENAPVQPSDYTPSACRRRESNPCRSGERTERSPRPVRQQQDNWPLPYEK